MQFLKGRLPNKAIGIIGTSLGGAATLLATPPLQVDAVVIEAVYPEFDRAIENRIRIRLGSLAPILAPLLVAQLHPRLGVRPSELRPIDHIANLRCPVLVIGGMEDRHTTEAETRLLFEAASPPKELWLIPARGHVDFFEAAGDDYRGRILSFLSTALRP